MKRIISALLVCVLLVGAMLTLASCGTMLSGKYELDVALAEVVYDFSMNKVSVTVSPIIGDDYVVEGTYKIAENSEGETEITFTFEKEDDNAKSGTFSFSKGDDYIKIGGLKYEKVD